jgi:hypothetical protein
MKTALSEIFKGLFHKALSTAWWMIKIMLPVSFAVMLLQYFGWLEVIASVFKPVFSLIGVGGEGALVFITSVLLNIYAAIAVIGTIGFGIREITILAIMCLIAHNLIIETAIQKKTGSQALRMVILRISMAIIAGFLFNWLLPASTDVQHIVTKAGQHLTLTEVLKNWVFDSVFLSFKVIGIIIGLMFIQRFLEYMGIMRRLSAAFRPLMKPFGLSENTSFHWLIANVVGLTYGSAIMIEQVESGKLKLHDADLLNHHVGISHSLLEDTLLFVAIGVSAWWIIFPRLILAMFAVWIYKAELFFLRKKNEISSVK